MVGHVTSSEDVNDLLVGPFRVTYTAGAGPRYDEYRLRYDVFVEEHHWLPAVGCPGRLEQDAFDAYCCSLRLTDASTGETAACERLILPDRLPQGLLTSVENKCRPSPSLERVDFSRLSKSSWAEVSRTTIARKYRWGGSAMSLPAMVAIKYTSIALAVVLDRAMLFSFSDPRTARLVRRLGFELHQIGEPIDYHGTRAPFRIDVAEVLDSVPQDWQGVLDRLIAAARRAIVAPDGPAITGAPHAA